MNRHWNLQNKKILITGGRGFLGKAVKKALMKRGVAEELILTPSSKTCDLTIGPEAESLFRKERPPIVIHAAAAVGGIGLNKEKPGTLYFNNVLMNTYVMEYARKYGVTRYVAIGSGCVYPASLTPPFKEEEIWMGPIEEHTAPYGTSKKIQIIQGQAYKKQYNFNSIVGLPGNLYGPGDNFQLETGHVIPSLVMKFARALDEKRDTLTCWGDGTPTRDFIYIDDAAEGIVTVLEKGEDNGVYNISSGIETSIEEVVFLLKEITGFKGRILWNKDKPNGQKRRCYDVSKLNGLGFRCGYGLEKGLRKTFQWFNESKQKREVRL